MTRIQDLLATWNPPSAASIAQVEIEDDSLRDGLQGAFMKKPTIEQKLALLRMSVELGAQASMMSFPASSADEFADCSRMVRAIDEEKLPIVPRCLARALPADVQAIADINSNADCDVWADFFVGTSPIRRHVEKWTLAEILTRIESTARVLVAQRTHFGISIEDASRTPAADLATVIRASAQAGVEIIMLCDTVGECTPPGARRLVEFTRDILDREGHAVRIWWHGHNDRGLATANAIAAAEAGVEAVSGTFGGIGERVGNTPLEQVLMYLWQGGNRKFRLDRMLPYCVALSQFGDSPISEHMPLIGKQAFATATGTHAAAVLKARALGPEFEDYVFSAVPASALGRKQDILIGPTSGTANARYMLEQLGLDAGEDRAAQLLAFARTKDRWLGPEQIRELFAAERAS